jgi:CRP-like cAMP-binding protein
MSADARHRVEKELFIRSFSVVPPTQRVSSQIIAGLRDHFLQPGDILYRAGEAATHIYFVVSGEVELADDEDAHWAFGSGAIVGILDALQDRDHARTALVRKTSHVIALEFAKYLDVLEDNFDFARQLLAATCRESNEVLLQLGADHVFATTAEPIGEQPFARSSGTQLGTMERLFALRSTPIFENAPVQALASLAHLASSRLYAAGERIYSIGEPNRAICVLVSGSVSLSLPAAGIQASVAPTRAIGGLACLGYEHHQYEAEALGECLTLVISREDLFDVMEDHLGLLRSLMRQVSVERERFMGLRHPPGLEQGSA